MKKSTLATKRKRQPETPATTTTTTATTSSAGQVDEKSEEGESRPRKKQKTILEVLLPPISSDEEADALRVPAHRGKATVQNEVARKGNGASSDVSDEDDSSPPKAKGKSERRSDARSKGAAAGSKASEESRSPQSNTKSKDVPRHRDRVTHADVASSDFEDLRPPKLKQKSTPKRKSPSEPQDDVSEKEVEPTAQPIKIGPPRGVKRREILRESRAPSKPGPSWTKPQEDGSADERVPAEQSISELDHEVSSSGDPLSRPQDAVGDRAFPPTHISIPQVPPNAPRHSHDLSPGALARLELFDRMVVGDAAPPPDVFEHVPNDSHFDLNVIHDTHGTFDTFDLPPPSSPPSKSKPKVGTPNGLIVPETEFSGNSQSQSPRKLDLPTIAVIAASAPSSSASPHEISLKLPPVTNRPSKKSITKTVPSIFRSTTHARSRVDDSEAPPSSIESFTTPRRVDKGKQKAVEDDQLRSSSSEGEEDWARKKKRTQMKTTDSQLKKRGKKLFDQAQLAREAEWLKNKKKPKRLKTIDEIVNGTVSSPLKGSPLPFTSAAEGTLEMQWEDIVDLSGGANSVTLDTVEHSEAKPLSEEERERLRIELRQEEEENTQEAMGGCPPPPVKESEAINGGDAQMPPPGSSKVKYLWCNHRLA